MTREDYSQFVHSRTKSLGTVTLDVLHAAVGCATEAGELLSTAKKMWVYNQQLDFRKTPDIPSNLENLEEEAGDLLFYVQMLCNRLGLDFEQLKLSNEAKLRVRYPQGYSDAAATARADKEPELPGIAPAEDAAVARWRVESESVLRTGIQVPRWVRLAFQDCRLYAAPSWASQTDGVFINVPGPVPDVYVAPGEYLCCRMDGTLYKQPT